MSSSSFILSEQGHLGKSCTNTHILSSWSTRPSVEGEEVFPGGIVGGLGETQKSPGLSPTCRPFWDPTALQEDSLLEKKSLPESDGGEK